MQGLRNSQLRERDALSPRTERLDQVVLEPEYLRLVDEVADVVRAVVSDERRVSERVVEDVGRRETTAHGTPESACGVPFHLRAEHDVRSRAIDLARDGAVVVRHQHVVRNIANAFAQPVAVVERVRSDEFDFHIEFVA